MQNTTHNFKKEFGQNFITNINSILETVDLLELTNEDIVLEVGPGDGRFSEVIASKAKELHMVEIDSQLIGPLRQKFANTNNVFIYNEDILRFEIKSIENWKFKTGNLKIFGALPYNISKPIIAKFLENEIKPERMVFITQKEVAEDYASLTPKASFLSNYARIFANVEYKGKIDKNYFYPTPKVDGGILRLFPTIGHSELDSESNVRALSKFIKQGFLNPRKKVIKSLKSQFKEIEWEAKLIEHGINPNARAAELSLENWINLYRTIT